MSVSSSVTDTSETREPAGSLSPSQQHLQQQPQPQHPGASGPSPSSSSYTQGQGNVSGHHSADGGHAARARARQRSKSGCLTCRLRKKRCDEAKPVCAMCTRLGLECLGFAAQRPDWMRRQDTVTNVVARMKKSVTDHNAAKMNAYWTSRANSLRDERDVSFQEMDAEYDPEMESYELDASMSPQQGPSGMPPVPLPTPVAMPADGGFTLPDSTQALIGDLSDLWAYPMPQAMVDNSPSHAGGVGPSRAASVTGSSPASVADGSVQTLTPRATSPMVDPAFLSLLGVLPHGYDLQTQQNNFGAAGNTAGAAAPSSAAPPYYPMLYQPAAMSGTAFPTTPTNMRFFRHYLEVIMPFQWIFERKALTDVVTPLAFTNPLVFESLIALGALHMGAKRSRGLLPANTHNQIPNMNSARIAAIPDNGDPDIAMAESSLRLSIRGLKQVPFNEFGTHEMIVSAMSVSSYHLFCGGNRRGWREAVDLCRKSLAAVLQGSRYWSSDDPESKLAIGALVQRMGHLLSPLVWTDILTSVTEGVTSQFLSLYRILLLDDQSQGEMGHLLRETVMGCDSTTRLAIAETIAFEEWKATAARVGSLSMRELVERANSIERLLGQRQWRERHLFDSNDRATLQRRAVSDVFFHSTRVLLATVLNGAFPGVVEVAAAVADVVDAFHQLDLVALQGAERALVFPTVMAGCHADTPELQMFFKDRFERLGEEAVAFGNTRNAMRLMEEVWRRRAASNSGEEVHWRQVMLELDEEGLLLI